MKLFFVIIILMLFFLRKNIESFLSELPYPPPSSIGRGSLCPVSPLLTKNIPHCMNGFFCHNESYADRDDIGRCRINRIHNNIFY